MARARGGRPSTNLKGGGRGKGGTRVGEAECVQLAGACRPYTNLKGVEEAGEAQGKDGGGEGKVYCVLLTGACPPRTRGG